MSNQMKLSQAISAKICHDLAGTVGTIDNCLDLMDKNNNIGKQAKNLVYLESTNLVNRLKFFRAVYGLASGEKNYSLIFLTKLFKDFFQNSEVKLQLKFAQELIFLETNLAKIMMCLATIARDNINSNGIMDILLMNENGHNKIEIHASAKSIKAKEENALLLANKKKYGVYVYNCREHYIKNLYKEINYRLTIEKDYTNIRYQLYKIEESV